MKVLSGIGASRGIRLGPAYFYQDKTLKIERLKTEDPNAEWRRLLAAIAESRQQLTDIYEQMKTVSGEELAAIFKAHLSMLKDPALLSTVQATIEDQKMNAEGAFEEAAEGYAKQLEQLESELISARAADVRDVKRRVLGNLLGMGGDSVQGLDQPSIVLARDLIPSQSARIDHSFMLGFCLAEGTPNSHAAILARGMGIPAVVALGEAVFSIQNGAELILDGEAGDLIVEPDEATTSKYLARKDRMQTLHEEARNRAHEPAITVDGVRKKVVANVASESEAQSAKKAGAEGIGLLRTEFVFIDRSELPDEQEQFEVYQTIFNVFGGEDVVLRTLDVGGDKAAPGLALPKETNPFLGLRGIRYSLRRTDLLKTQLKAALRAGAGHSLKIMFPMVATISELLEARTVLDECQMELTKVGTPYALDLEIGVMIEVPAAAIIVDQLSEHVDFFSIGSNDLSQYVMAADRTSMEVAGLVSALNPAVLRLINRVIVDAHEHGRWVGLCGEMAGDPVAIPILTGMGLDEFSMVPSRISIAKEVIRALSVEEASVLAHEAIEMRDQDEVTDLVRSRVNWVGFA